MTKSLTYVTSQKEDTAGVNIPEAVYSYADMDGIHYLTFSDIMEEYYPYWSRKMLEKGGLAPLITIHNCIDDWRTVHWAQYN